MSTRNKNVYPWPNCYSYFTSATRITQWEHKWPIFQVLSSSYSQVWRYCSKFRPFLGKAQSFSSILWHQIHVSWFSCKPFNILYLLMLLLLLLFLSGSILFDGFFVFQVFFFGFISWIMSLYCNDLASFSCHICFFFFFFFWLLDFFMFGCENILAPFGVNFTPQCGETHICMFF